MTQPQDWQSDELMELLTDALRAGPGSPAWHDAVTRLKPGSGVEVDEYRLILRAREHLEAGKEWREVRAGPGFTRRVMERLEIERHRQGRRRTWGLWMIGLSIIVALGVLSTLIFLNTAEPSPLAQELSSLPSTYFVEPVLDESFSRNQPEGWRIAGPVDLQFFGRGVRSRPAEGDDFQGGALLYETPLAPETPFMLEAVIRAGADEVVIPQVFVTDDPTLDPVLTTTPHELVWLVQNAQAKVSLPDGQFPADGKPIGQRPREMTVRMIVGTHAAIVDVDGERLWIGAHELDPKRERYIGLRFLRKGSGGREGAMVESVRLLRARQPSAR